MMRILVRYHSHGNSHSPSSIHLKFQAIELSQSLVSFTDTMVFPFLKWANAPSTGAQPLPEFLSRDQSLVVTRVRNGAAIREMRNITAQVTQKPTWSSE